ncbi:hypothetical protein [Paenibacillus sp. R14(2021)]|uniref:hypothetical protein n=1 Tax=Paenibacillus sp. R14(2021) TaxID=2859228 RepID=UPI001C6144F5|nr:hypothetical protein [Paenibacillus sp. R14(2021)]
MSEDVKDLKPFSETGFWAKLKTQASNARLMLVYSSFVIAFLLPIIYASDWPERGWC